jgi:hypothetical protein
MGSCRRWYGNRVDHIVGGALRSCSRQRIIQQSLTLLGEQFKFRRIEHP